MTKTLVGTPDPEPEPFIQLTGLTYTAVITPYDAIALPTTRTAAAPGSLTVTWKEVTE